MGGNGFSAAGAAAVARRCCLARFDPRAKCLFLAGLVAAPAPAPEPEEKTQQASDSNSASRAVVILTENGTFRMRSAALSAELGVKQQRFGLMR